MRQKRFVENYLHKKICFSNIFIFIYNIISKVMKKYYMDPIFFAFKVGFGVLLSNWGPGIPVINLEGVPGPQVPRSNISRSQSHFYTMVVLMVLHKKSFFCIFYVRLETVIWSISLFMFLLKKRF